MFDLQATPYVPGHARGILQRGCRNASASTVCLLTQAELATLGERPAGVIVIDGAPFSHPMIRLLVLGIPTVVVTAGTADALEQGRAVFIDGLAGRIMQPVPAGPPGTHEPEPPPGGTSLELHQGGPVQLRASIIDSEDATRAVSQGAAAIGLVRTEFMVPDDGSLPDRAFYETRLAALCQAAAPLTVTLRLPDITLDKPVPWLDSAARLNTPLGMQGVRLFDLEPVRTVVNALLDAVRGLTDTDQISLLVPYVTQLQEFQRWRDHIEQRLGRTLAVGAMAESPAAVLAMRHWFDHADFVAIGCNDLMQCLFAADRDLAETQAYLDPCAPELYRFLQQAADAAGDAIDRVQLCGLLPQLPGVLPVLIGMGYRVFAVAPVMLPYLAETVRAVDLSRAQALAAQVCDARDSSAVRRLL